MHRPKEVADEPTPITVPAAHASGDDALAGLWAAGFAHGYGDQQSPAAALWAAYGSLSASGRDVRERGHNAIPSGEPAGYEPSLSPLPRANQWRALIGRYVDWDEATMMRIVSCESHGDENAVSDPDYDGIRNYGILQLHGDPEGLNPEYAVEQAHEKWLARGYQPWVGSRGCWGG